MSTSTVLRVKRRLEDNPQDALVLMCKRAKTEADQELSPSLFVFRGTVENQETTTVKNLLPKNNIKLDPKTSVTDIITKIRKERKAASTESRYEIVNCTRGLTEESDVKTEEVFDVVDLKEKKEHVDGESYAYDLYTPAKPDFHISMLDDLVSIENIETELIFGSYRDNGQRSPNTSDGEESDDSNDENNWRNDYPDTDHSSIDENDMIRAVERIDIEDDLSSDGGEDRIYDGPADVLNEDVKRYGAAYAKYKARVMSENPDLSDSRNFVHSTVEEVNGYKSDDDGFYYGEDEDTDQFKEQYRQDSSDEYDDD